MITFMSLGLALFAGILLALAPFVGGFRLMYRRERDQEDQ